MSRACILVVEDEDDLRESLAEALAESGVDVKVAADGLEALERLRAGLQPSVILADLNMPRLGGAAFVAAIRAEPRWSGIPVITMTGGIDEPSAPVSAHLEKPFDVGDLLAIIVSLCEAGSVTGALGYAAVTSARSTTPGCLTRSKDPLRDARSPA